MPARSVALTPPLALTTHPVRGFKDYFYFGAKKICLATLRRTHVFYATVLSRDVYFSMGPVVFLDQYPIFFCLELTKVRELKTKIKQLQNVPHTENEARRLLHLTRDTAVHNHPHRADLRKNIFNYILLLDI